MAGHQAQVMRKVRSAEEALQHGKRDPKQAARWSADARASRDESTGQLVEQPAITPCLEGFDVGGDELSTDPNLREVRMRANPTWDHAQQCHVAAVYPHAG